MRIVAKIKSSIVVLMTTIVISKLIGMLRDVVLANYYGTSNISDAYLIAISVPTLLFYFISHALSTAFLPMYNKIRETGGKEAAQTYTNNLLCIAFCACTVIVAVLLLFPEFIIKIFATGFDDKTLALTTKLVQYSAGSVYFMTIINIWGGYLQADSNFIVPASISIPRNVVLIVSIAVSTQFGIEHLGVGILFAYIAEFLLLLPFVFKSGFHFQPKFQLNSPEMRETLYLILPIIIGVGVSQINKIVDKSIASTIVSGGISALSYAAIINNAIQEVLVTGIITVLFAKCSAWVAEENHEKVKEKLSETISVMAFLLIPASLGVIICAESIVVCILCRGEFTATSLHMTVNALRCYTCGLTFLAIRDTLVKVFYAYKNTKTTTVTSIGAIILNIVLNLILSRFWGINGLAIATSVSAIVQSLTLYVILHRKIGDFGTHSIFVTGMQSLASGFIMVAAISLLRNMLLSAGIGEFSGLVIQILAGFVVYMFCSLLFRSSILLKWIRKFASRGQNKS